MSFPQYRLNCLFCLALLGCSSASAQVFTQQGGKLVGTDAVYAGSQGWSVALSGDGSTALVGGPNDDGETGAVWVYIRDSNGNWTQQGNKLAASGTSGEEQQGYSVALSADGNTALVGAPGDSGNIGAAWVFTRDGNGNWSQQGNKLVGSGATGPAVQGYSVALSADGNTALLGGYLDNSYIGAAWVFTRDGGVWSQQGSKLVGSGAVGTPEQGLSVSLSGDGNTALLGGPLDNSGIGAVWVFARSGGVWSQQGSKLVGSGAVGLAGQGVSTALSEDGSTAAEGGSGDNSSVGATWVFTRTAGVWSQQGSKLTGSDIIGEAQQGSSVALSADGNTTVIGGPYDNSEIGAMWVFTRNGGAWSQQGSKITGANPVGQAYEGWSVALSGDGNTALLGGQADNNGIGAAWPFARALSESLEFVPVTPCRVVDTRKGDGPFGGPELAGGVSRTFSISRGECGIPSTASAYSLNVAVVPDAQLGYLTIWPAGQSQPVVSVLNSDGRVKANATITPAGSDGGINVFASNPTQVVIDIDGYFVPAGTSTLAFYPLAPCRVADTRKPDGPLAGPYISGGAAGRAFPIQSSSCSIPSTAQAYSLNFTAVPRGPLGYVTVWPTGEAQPVVSTLNAPTNAVTANAAIVPVGSNGDISVYASNDTDMVIDTNGYFAPPDAGGLSLYTLTPCRALDTRKSSGVFSGTLPVSISGSSCGALTSQAQAFVLNATVVPQGPLGYLTLWADGEARPAVSNLNAVDGIITSNLAIVPANNGSIDAFATSSTQLILDISGFFAP